MPTSAMIANVIQKGYLAFDSAQKVPVITSQLATLNYTPAKLGEGKTLLQLLENKQNQQQLIYAQQKEATGRFHTLKKEFEKIYSKQVKLARLLLEDRPELAERLTLNNRREQALGPWLLQTKQFYREALASTEILELLALGGLTQAQLQAVQTQLTPIEQAYQVAEQTKAQAQQTTLERNGALKSYQNWHKTFWKVAQVALIDYPQLLETLGGQAVK